MDVLTAEFGLVTVALAFAVMAFGGFVKGAVGFALPMITISGVGSLMSAELAVAAILLPGLVTNVMQAFRQGLGAAWGTLRRYWRINLVLLLLIGVFAQLIVLLPSWLLFVILGSMVSVFGVLQLTGWRPDIPGERMRAAEWVTGVVASIFGGLAGVWGPPILMYLMARETPKQEQVRAQGIAFLIGCIVLIVAHHRSGLLNTVTLPFSAWLVVPAVLGMVAGQAMQDRLDQGRFRRLTLVVLVIAGLNLLRRGLF